MTFAEPAHLDVMSGYRPDMCTDTMEEPAGGCTLTDLWPCMYLRTFGMEEGHKSLLQIGMCVCLCMSPPPGQGRTPRVSSSEPLHGH